MNILAGGWGQPDVRVLDCGFAPGAEQDGDDSPERKSGSAAGQLEEWVTLGPGRGFPQVKLPLMFDEFALHKDFRIFLIPSVME